MLNLSAVDENKDIATKEYADTKALKTEAIKNITRSGTTFTATRCDNTTFTFTQQDNNSVTGVKGNSESSYRTGNVNLTAANIGAAASNHTHSIVDIGWPYYKQTVDNRTMRTMFDSTRANRLAFLPASQIIAEKTTDGGATWVDAGFTDAQKENLFAETRGYYAPIPMLNSAKNQNCGLRFTITAMRYDVPSGTPETEKYAYWNSSHVLSQERYAYLSEMYFWVNATNDQISVKVEAANGNSSTTWSTRFEDSSFGMVGWSGNDYISLSGGSFGGSVNQVSQFWNWRITLMTKFTNGSSPVNASQQSIGEIRAYGYAFWGSPNNYMANDHLYSWDYQKNATFPAQITATKFNGSLNGNATKAKQLVPDTNRPTSANTGATNTTALVHYLATSSMTTGKPMADGHILEADWDNSGGWKSQLFLPCESNLTSRHLQWRAQNGGGWGSWITVLDTNSTIDASTVGGHTVNADVPANAVFTDTVTRVKGNSESTYRSGDVNLTAANIGAAASSHAHGNITSGGDITAAAPTVASGDCLVINDDSASKITNGPAFGTSTTTYLRNDGTWATPAGGGGGSSIAKLWQNSSITSSFAAQTITVSGSWDAYIISFIPRTDYGAQVSVVFPADGSAKSFGAPYGSTNCYRAVTCNSSSLVFDGGHSGSNCGIPTCIWGIKY